MLGNDENGEIRSIPSARPGKAAYDVKGQRFEVSSKYELIEVVGVGAYGVVVSAKNQETDELVAIKRVADLYEDLVDAKRVLREIRLMRLLNHENVSPACNWHKRLSHGYLVFVRQKHRSNLGLELRYEESFLTLL